MEMGPKSAGIQDLDTFFLGELSHNLTLVHKLILGKEKNL